MDKYDILSRIRRRLVEASYNITWKDECLSDPIALSVMDIDNLYNMDYTNTLTNNLSVPLDQCTGSQILERVWRQLLVHFEDQFDVHPKHDDLYNMGCTFQDVVYTINGVEFNIYDDDNYEHIELCIGHCLADLYHLMFQ